MPVLLVPPSINQANNILISFAYLKKNYKFWAWFFWKLLHIEHADFSGSSHINLCKCIYLEGLSAHYLISTTT